MQLVKHWHVCRMVEYGTTQMYCCSQVRKLITSTLKNCSGNYNNCLGVFIPYIIWWTLVSKISEQPTSMWRAVRWVTQNEVLQGYLTPHPHPISSLISLVSILLKLDSFQHYSRWHAGIYLTPCIGKLTGPKWYSITVAHSTWSKERPFQHEMQSKQLTEKFLRYLNLKIRSNHLPPWCSLFLSSRKALVTLVYMLGVSLFQSGYVWFTGKSVIPESCIFVGLLA